MYQNCIRPKRKHKAKMPHNLVLKLITAWHRWDLRARRRSSCYERRSSQLIYTRKSWTWYGASTVAFTSGCRYMTVQRQRWSIHVQRSTFNPSLNLQDNPFEQKMALTCCTTENVI
jgi:hypothetical protein